MKAKTQYEDTAISVLKFDQAVVKARILFRTPLVMNRMPQKAREQLLLPPPPKNKAARLQTLKHDPPNEFRDSVYHRDR
jgi:hypothetical protein